MNQPWPRDSARLHRLTANCFRPPLFPDTLRESVDSQSSATWAACGVLAQYLLPLVGLVLILIRVFQGKIEWLPTEIKAASTILLPYQLVFQPLLAVILLGQETMVQLSSLGLRNALRSFHHSALHKRFFAAALRDFRRTSSPSVHRQSTQLPEKCMLLLLLPLQWCLGPSRLGCGFPPQ